MSDRAGDPAQPYRAAAEAHRAARDRYSRRSRRISTARLVTFLAGAACLLAAIPGAEGRFSIPLAVGGAAAIATFFVLVYHHSQVEAGERAESAHVTVNDEAAARVERRWHELPPGPGGNAPTNHPYADDLDLFGHASLFKLLGSVGTEAGRQTLSRWLLEGAAPEAIRERQAAVRELAGLPAWREALAATGRLVEPQPHELEIFLGWAESPAWLTPRKWLLWTARLTAASFVLLAALHATGAVNRALWLYPLVLSLALIAGFEKRIHHTFSQAFARERLFNEHAALFAHIAETRFDAPLLQHLVGELHASGPSAQLEMASLGRLMRLADLRFQAFFHFPINVATLWDFHVLAALEQWQARTGRHLRRWFAALGEVDALSAFAWLAHDNPSWAFPEVAQDSNALLARDLAHPLLQEDRRVANDVEVGPPGSCLLVTGSNMSGKSTLLRAIGVNAVLAQAGAPVCARSLVMPPLAPFTSMRVQDSLEEGVSYFMAALRRLKLLVSAAEQTRAGQPLLLYLLDEILQGTNTAERQIAVRRILAHLLALPAIGAVTTHDLELAASPELAATARPVHFTEGVEQDGDAVKLSFDYRLRPGIATSRNALKLLHLVGLDR